MTVRTGSDLEKLWAKSAPYHSLWKHLLGAAAVSLALGNPLERFGWSAEQAALLVGLHDVGKADAGFQHQINDFKPELEAAGFPVTADRRCRHERLSAAFVKGKLEAAGLNDFTVGALAMALVAHHGWWDPDARGVVSEAAFDRVYWQYSKGGVREQAVGGILFNGVVAVHDPDRFRQTFRDGIGPGKAFGFGLLSLAPA